MRSWKWSRMTAGLCATLAAGAMAPGPALAQKSADTLRVYWRDQVVDVDPYFNSQRTGLILAHHFMDGLIYRDPEGFVMKPLLATAWRWVDDTTLEFDLRPGVTFANGDKFTADDVVYTVGVVTDPKSGISVPSNYTWLAGAEKIDDLKVRLKLKQPFPAALEYVSFVMPIYPSAYRQKVGHDGFKKEPVGVGPYKVTRVDGPNQVDMERFEGYYDGSSKGRPAIRKLVIKEVADATTELTALLGGNADWIWQFNPDQFDQIARMPTLNALRQEAFRIAFLYIDAAGRSAKGPLTDPRVRRAMMHAIDREAFARRLVQGGARVPDAPCYFTQFGCDQSAAVKYDYDPAKARALLAEAGYAQGFDTEIVSANMLTSWSGALQSYLGAVGIRAKVTTLQGVASVARVQNGDAPIFFNSWGSYSINDASAIIPYFFSGTTDDMARDAGVTELLKNAGSVTDPEIRKKLYADAIHRITEQAYWIPISTYTTTYGISRTLDFKAYPDEMPRFFLSKWK